MYQVAVLSEAESDPTCRFEVCVFMSVPNTRKFHLQHEKMKSVFLCQLVALKTVFLCQSQSSVSFTFNMKRVGLGLPEHVVDVWRKGEDRRKSCYKS